MNPLRVVVGKLEPSLLHDSLMALLDQDARVEVLADAIESHGLASTAAQLKADVVVYSLPHAKLPPIAVELLDAIPTLVTVGVVPNGQHFAIHVLNINLKDMLAVILAERPARGEHGV